MRSFASFVGLRLNHLKMSWGATCNCCSQRKSREGDPGRALPYHNGDADLTPRRTARFQQVLSPFPRSCTASTVVLTQVSSPSLLYTYIYATTHTGFEQPGFLSKCRMQIFIAGPNGSSTAYSVEADASIESIKLMIENQEFVPSHLIRLVNGGQDLEGGSLIGNGVEDEDTLTMLLDVNGGMRRKWRKKRMRRLRRKRRKMRQRAR